MKVAMCRQGEISTIVQTEPLLQCLGCRKQLLIDQANLAITGPDLWGACKGWIQDF